MPTLTARGIGPHTDTTVDLAQPIIAPSGWGKTTLIHAWCWLIHGGGAYTRSLPSHLYRDGETTEVIYRADSGVRIERRRTARGSDTRQLVLADGTVRAARSQAEWEGVLGAIATEDAALAVVPRRWIGLLSQLRGGPLRDAILARLDPGEAARRERRQRAEEARRVAKLAHQGACEVLARARERLTESTPDEDGGGMTLAEAKAAVTEWRLRQEQRREAQRAHQAWTQARAAAQRAAAAHAAWTADGVDEPTIPRDVARWVVETHTHAEARPCSRACAGVDAALCGRAAGDPAALAAWEDEAAVIAGRKPKGAARKPPTIADARSALAAWGRYDAWTAREPRVPDAVPPEPTIPDDIPDPTEARRVIAAREAAAVYADRAQAVADAEARVERTAEGVAAAEAEVSEARTSDAAGAAVMEAAVAGLSEHGLDLHLTDDGCDVTYRGVPLYHCSTGEQIAADMGWRMWWRGVIRQPRLPVWVDEAQSSTLLPAALPAGVVMLLTR